MRISTRNLESPWIACVVTMGLMMLGWMIALLFNLTGFLFWFVIMLCGSCEIPDARWMERYNKRVCDDQERQARQNSCFVLQNLGANARVAERGCLAEQITSKRG